MLVLATRAALVGDDSGAGASLTGDTLIAAGVLTAAAYVVVVQDQIAGFHVQVLSFYQFLFGLAVIGAATGILAVTGHGPRSWTGCRRAAPHSGRRPSRSTRLRDRIVVFVSTTSR